MMILVYLPRSGRTNVSERYFEFIYSVNKMVQGIETHMEFFIAGSKRVKRVKV